MIDDQSHDSDKPDQTMAERGIELISPNRENRSKTKDLYPRRRYKRRWKLDRRFAWLQNCPTAR